MKGLDFLAAEDESASAAPPLGRSPVVLPATIVTGVAGAILWRKHPVLGLLDGFAVGNSMSRFFAGEINLRHALENLGSHAVATAGSLSLRRAPVLGYIAGGVASNLFIKRKGSLFAKYEETMLGGARDDSEEIVLVKP